MVNDPNFNTAAWRQETARSLYTVAMLSVAPHAPEKMLVYGMRKYAPISSTYQAGGLRQKNICLSGRWV